MIEKIRWSCLFLVFALLCVITGVNLYARPFTFNWSNPETYQDGSPLLASEIVHFTLYCNDEPIAIIINTSDTNQWIAETGIFVKGDYTWHLSVTTNRDGPEVESDYSGPVFIRCSRSRAQDDEGVICGAVKEL